jgi:hypothetical protein
MTGLRATFRTAEGWAVEHAVLTVTDPAGRQVARQAADVRGEVVTDALPAGTYTAVVTAAGYTPIARMTQVASDGSGSLGDVVLAPVAEAIDLPPAGPWVIDPMHSSVVATARHLGIASIKARFPDVSGCATTTCVRRTSSTSTSTRSSRSRAPGCASAAWTRGR